MYAGEGGRRDQDHRRGGAIGACRSRGIVGGEVVTVGEDRGTVLVGVATVSAVVLVVTVVVVAVVVATLRGRGWRQLQQRWWHLLLFMWRVLQ